MSAQPNALPETPSYVADLQAVYGFPSQAGFGSAVFYEQVEQAEDLERIALKYYQYFVGDLWERFGEEVWMASWKPIYSRNSDGNKQDVVNEMRSIADNNVALSVSMLLDNRDDSEIAQKALSATYNLNPSDLMIYTLGDGGAMSGILIAGRRSTSEAIFLVFLMD